MESNPNQSDRILQNTASVVPLIYISSFCRSFEMPLIDCKVELKLKWKKHCILAAAGTDNTTLILVLRILFLLLMTQNYMFLLSLYQQTTIKN